MAIKPTGLDGNSTTLVAYDLALPGELGFHPDLVTHIVSFIFYLGFAVGLYILSKKLGEKYAWLSFIPVVQYYSLAKAGGKSIVSHILIPLAILIIGAPIMMIIFTMIGGIVGGIGAVISYVGAIIYMLVMYVKILSGISQRTHRGGWSTFGLFFVPWIMLPVIAHKFENKGSHIKKTGSDATIQDSVEL